MAKKLQPKAPKTAPVKTQSKFKPRVETHAPASGGSDFTTIPRKKPFLG